MKEIVLYLVGNPEVLKSVKKGHSHLLGVSAEETKAIVKSFEGNQENLYYWA